MSVTDARPIGTYALVAFCGTERRFCASVRVPADASFCAALGEHRKS
jgi:hypothetical protein